jgi:hypothetical protein
MTTQTLFLVYLISFAKILQCEKLTGKGNFGQSKQKWERAPQHIFSPSPLMIYLPSKKNRGNNISNFLKKIVWEIDLIDRYAGKYSWFSSVRQSLSETSPTKSKTPINSLQCQNEW